MTVTIERSVTARPGTAVELAGVSKVFGYGNNAVTALSGIDLQVRSGEFVVLLGASGCGKTTLLNVIAGLDDPTTGAVTVGGRQPAVMFQEPALLPWLTAARNVELPLRLARVPRAVRRKRATELLELVRLAGQGDKRPHELSGGMRQRVALARALAAAGGDEPGLLLMDEPFAALDAITRDFLQGELESVHRATGNAILFVTHDVHEAVRLGQRVVLLSSRPGTVVAEWDLTTPDVDRDDVAGDITARLRQVIATHAGA